jgi:hypothetical protein
MAPTRRQALSSGVALLAALAGCNSLTDGSQSGGSDGSDGDGSDDGRPRFDRPENVAMDPPTVTLRRPEPRERIVEIADPDQDGDLNRTQRERRRAVQDGFVTGPEAASWVQIDDVEGADDARQFLDETDFESAFVFLDRGSVRQCYEQHLCYVTWDAFELRRTYAEVYRDYDVACRTGEYDSVARFVRLDGNVDPLEIESGGTHTRYGGCPVPRWELDERLRTGKEATAATDETPAGNGTAATEETTVTGETGDAQARYTGWAR